MNDYKPPSRSVIKADSVRRLIERVNITFGALLVLGSCITVFLIYMPLNNALQLSLINNFGQLSSVQYNSIQDAIQRSVEGTTTLAGRTSLRTAIQEYLTGQSSLEEMIAYIQPRFGDSAKTLSHLIWAQRSMDGLTIASYALLEDEADPALISVLPQADFNPAVRLQIRSGSVYLAVRAPVVLDSQIIAWDTLVFDLTNYIRLLSTDIMQTQLVGRESYELLMRGAKKTYSGGDMLITETEELFIASLEMREDIHFVSSQSKYTLFTPIHMLSANTLAASSLILVAFIAVVYVYVVRFAKRELSNLEVSNTALEQVASEVNIDSLTGAYSRRGGTKVLLEYFTAFRNGAASPLIMMFDIDSFKAINDRFGHDVGDRVLEQTAAAIFRAVRSEDRLVRWGGDEFIGIFHDMKPESALPFARKLLDAVSALRIDTGKESIGVTISIGITHFQDTDVDFTSALKRADEAMYLSKAQGKNRIEYC